MNKILKQFLIYFLILIISIPVGVLIGIRNLDENYINTLNFSELHSDVKVYRDQYGIPTIVAADQHDLFFAQGYEYARDRLFQAEFYRSVANGQLSRLFGPGDNNSLIKSDQFLRTIGIKDAAQIVWDNTSPQLQQIVVDYVAGLNKFIDTHHENLPLEFQLLSIGQLTQGNFKAVKPLKWTPQDAVAIQGVMAYDLAFDAANRELLRQNLLSQFGPEKALELMPIMDPTARAYFLNQTNTAPAGLSLNVFKQLQKNVGYLGFKGSNDWVVNGSKTSSGLPILANDPHLGLSTPSIWWQVQLYAADGSYHTQGYALPGIPGIVLGHNQNVVWGFTNTGTDSIDLYYLNTRTQDGVDQYFINGQWKPFVIKTVDIPVSGEDTQQFTIKMTDYGPVLDKELFGITDGKTYAMQWTLLSTNQNNSIFDAIMGLNTAKTADDVHNALSTFSVPGQNIVFATTSGDIGYQYTGFVPNRKVPGSGVLPQNGSDSKFGWDGFIPYDQYLYVKNPESGYFATANQKIDNRDQFYINDLYDTPYRGNRINALLSASNSIDNNYMRNIQADVQSTYAIDLLKNITSTISNLSFTGDNAAIAEKAVNILLNWDHNMFMNSTGATIFGAFRIYYEEQTFFDEMQNTGIKDMYADYAGIARYVLPSISENNTSTWFDDIRTPNIVETRDMIVQRAFNDAINFLIGKLGSNPNKWTYGRIHKVIFEHPIGTAVPLFNFNTGNVASPGADMTVDAGSNTPRWSEDGPEFLQDFGPSMRLVAKVEPTWSQVEGINAPGISGNYNDAHRSDSLKDWVNVVNHPWNFNISDIQAKESPSFIFKKV